jgi:hypothetical protein
MNPDIGFELFTQRIYQKLVNNDVLKPTEVRHNVKLEGRSGCKHQIDVYWEYEIAGNKHRVAIECKNYDSLVPIGKVRDFQGVLSDLNNVNGTDLIMQGINGRADALGQLSQITHTSVEAVRSVLSTIQASIQEVTAQTGMSALQIQNAIQSGNAALSQQLCQCCCENRLAIAN